MNHGKVIKARRKDLGWTQERLSTEADISIFKIVQVEKGGKKLTLKELCRVGEALCLPTIEDWYNFEGGLKR